jgi:hypothetical protein
MFALSFVSCMLQATPANQQEAATSLLLEQVEAVRSKHWALLHGHTKADLQLDYVSQQSSCCWPNDLSGSSES